MEHRNSLPAVRIVLAAYTASFCVPAFVGHQLTLPVPPLSTIFGLLSAAAGKWIMPDEVEWLAYRCTYKSKGTDLETIVKIERKKPQEVARPKSPPETINIVQREFLTLPCLTLYLPPKWESPFRQPRYSLLLGRTQDVAGVMPIALTELKSVNTGTVSGVLLPFELVALNNVSAWLQKLPIAFNDEPQRRPTRMHLFGIVDPHRPAESRNGNGWLVQDNQNGAILVLYCKEWMLYGEQTISQVR